jgi:hypothetical protein
VKVELPMPSPGAETSALDEDEPKFDQFEKLEEPEDFKGISPRR